MLKYILCSALLYLSCFAIGFTGGMEYIKIFTDSCDIYKISDSNNEKVNDDSNHNWISHF